ncbi:MAG: hypothetical protein O2809_01470 [Proteobacteria bacterium]|nr:hypothetical protein [Pseudomonadota bacterium]
MSLSKLFEKIGSPLKNNRWSWGAVRKDGTVFLRVWQDEKETVDGKKVFRVTNHQKYINMQDDLGYKERLEHIELILKGAAQVYLVMCKAKDENAVPRAIESYNKKDLFVGGSIIDFNGDKWVEMCKRIPISEIST